MEFLRQCHVQAGRLETSGTTAMRLNYADLYFETFQVDNVTSKMARRDIGDSIIEIKHNTGTDKWLVTKKLLDASKISPQVNILNYRLLFVGIQGCWDLTEKEKISNTGRVHTQVHN
jgi:hypothetical protein